MCGRALASSIFVVSPKFTHAHPHHLLFVRFVAQLFVVCRSDLSRGERIFTPRLHIQKTIAAFVLCCLIVCFFRPPSATPSATTPAQPMSFRIAELTWPSFLVSADHRRRPTRRRAAAPPPTRPPSSSGEKCAPSVAIFDKPTAAAAAAAAVAFDRHRALPHRHQPHQQQPQRDAGASPAAVRCAPLPEQRVGARRRHPKSGCDAFSHDGASGGSVDRRRRRRPSPSSQRVSHQSAEGPAGGGGGHQAQEWRRDGGLSVRTVRASVILLFRIVWVTHSRVESRVSPEWRGGSTPHYIDVYIHI